MIDKFRSLVTVNGGHLKRNHFLIDSKNISGVRYVIETVAGLRINNADSFARIIFTSDNACLENDRYLRM